MSAELSGTRRCPTGTVVCRAPPRHPEGMESVFLPEPRANTRGMNPALTAHGLQSQIKMIKRLQGRAGSLAQGWRQRWGHQLCWVLTTEAFEPGKGCSCPLLCCSWCLGKELISQDRDSPGAHVPPLTGAWLSSCGGFSPVSIQTLKHTHLEDPLWPAPRGTVAIFLFTLPFSSAFDVEGSGCCCEGQSI